MVYVVMYLSAIVAANLLVSYFGPSISILNAFLFIGLDLTARDKLHEAWVGKRLFLKMIGLIATGSILSWLLNHNAGKIALASFIAFACAGVVDTLVYHLLWERDRARWLRINGSNIASALVDSVVFPSIAFGFPLLVWVMIGQFLAKAMGGFLWSLVLVPQRSITYYYYDIRKFYVKLNPFISTRDYADCVQYIMRDAPLIQNGIPFFLEPWLQPSDYWCNEERDSITRPFIVELIVRFTREFIRWYNARKQYQDS